MTQGSPVSDTGAQGDVVRVLFVEDVAAETELALHRLHRGGAACQWQRVDTGPELHKALYEFPPTVILNKAPRLHEPCTRLVEMIS